MEYSNCNDQRYFVLVQSTDMRIVPGLGSHVGIKLRCCLLELCLSESIVLLEREHYMVSEVKYETEIQPPIQRIFG